MCVDAYAMSTYAYPHTRATTEHFSAICEKTKRMYKNAMNVLCARMMHHLLTKNLMDFWCFPFCSLLAFSFRFAALLRGKETHCHCVLLCCLWFCQPHLTTQRITRICVHPHIIAYTKTVFFHHHITIIGGSTAIYEKRLKILPERF